jgi:glycosyltransferase involved in cell wall biosynthesis
MKKEKYLTIAVPCYNSQEYMRRCVDSLLPGGEDVEIILIDDGSTDRTGEIADEYAKQYPGIVQAVHKENGGHGSGVNLGMKLAKGVYFKVVDSDDWLEETAYRKLLEQLKTWIGSESENEKEHAQTTIPDLIVCNYVYNHLDEGVSRTMSYRNVFPEKQICMWEEIGHFRPSQYLVMHALIYRTEVLRESGIELPEHTFYVDNIFACQPLPYVKSIYYMDLDLYQYYLGRADQSVNEKVLMSRIDQQIRVTKIVAECTDLEEVKKTSPKLADYLYRNISIMMAISSIHLLLIQNEEAEAKRKRLWKEIREKNAPMYYRLKYTKLSGWTDLPGSVGRKLTVNGYRLAKKIYRFQ